MHEPLTSLRVLRDRCGVIGVFGHRCAARLVHTGLHALQHRGQDGAGIVAGDGWNLTRRAGVGLVTDVFGAVLDAASDAEELRGDIAVGHVRYATSGERDAVSLQRDVQPLLQTFLSSSGKIALAHNGHIVNAQSLRCRLEAEGAVFATRSDTEVIGHLMTSSAGPLEERLAAALSQVQGAYALCVVGEGKLIGVRDPAGVRPLVLGVVDDGWVLASETCALEAMGADWVRDVAPGEMVVLDEDGVRTRHLKNPQRWPVASCAFEQVYFARPDSVVKERFVHETRMRLGQRLATEHPVEADIVVPIPDGGIYPATGYALATGLPLVMGLARSPYVGRSFITSGLVDRALLVERKFTPVTTLLAGKRVVLVDDSLVRGTTLSQLVHRVRAAGAVAVHVRVASPPVVAPCHYGIDTPTEGELLASRLSLTEMQREIEADSLAYLSVGGLHEVLGGGLCDACFSRRYPIPLMA